ncbi:MAG TPA: glucose-6-phosphate isomerase [Actinomycetota bacterium]|nr:glucose-6-phosphate isomerase [Actinomycetota bacterium]
MSEVLALDALLNKDLQAAVDARLRRLGDDDVVGRIWARDHTVWRDDPREISDRLGWLTAPHTSRRLIPDLRAFADQAAADGLTHAVLLGMGGSSLAPEVFRRTFGKREDMLDLVVLDSTHPDAIRAVERDVPLDRTLFVVSSKSGTTIETRSHLAYFHELVGAGDRFVAVTDPGTPLEATANELGFRGVFNAPPDVGGRYSALTVFGLLPAALIGADLDELLQSAAGGAAACGGANPPGVNPGAALGAIVGEAAVRGRDKLTLVLPAAIGALGTWIEQLVAESTGKDGTGILPVDGEPAGPPDAFGDDRLFLTFGETAAPEPFAHVPLGDPASLGAVMFILEFATAVAGHVLRIHPFDQPDVQSAKDRTSEMLSSGPAPEPLGEVDELLASVRPGDYVAIQTFVPPGEELRARLEAARLRIRNRLRVATTLGYGPRYLHSTGQLHKGGPNTGVFIQLLEEPEEDVPVPGRSYTFGRLIAAQAAGDLAALRERGRRAARVPIDALVGWDG